MQFNVDGLVRELNSIQGLLGEFLTYLALSGFPAPRRFVWDALLEMDAETPSGEPEDTQIDLIMLHTSGIYVLEVKDRCGEISGWPWDRTWTQAYRKKGAREEHQFYNPLLQNFAHCAAVAKALDLTEKQKQSALHPLVVFTDRARFGTKLSLPGEPVIRLKQLNNTVERIAKQSSACFTPAELNRFYDRLLPATAPSAQRVQRHRQRVAEKARQLPDAA